MSATAFRYHRIPTDAEPLREQVRAFLTDALKTRSPLKRAESWMGADPAFSRELGRRG
jgi:hypothetical protein